jgi:hypothetical protein
VSAAPRYDDHADWYDEWIADPEGDFVARCLLDSVGVDLSARLLEIARRGEAREPLGITYVGDDACTTTWWDGTPFDGVVSSMALMDIDDVEGAVRTAAVVLGPSG